MATLKLKPHPPAPDQKPSERDQAPRSPVRGAGSGVKKRPTLAEAQALRAEREARYQEQLRQRYGDRPPATAQRGPDNRPPPRAARLEPHLATRPERQHAARPEPQRGTRPEPQHAARPEPQRGARPEPAFRPERAPVNTAFGQRPPQVQERGHERGRERGQDREQRHGPSRGPQREPQRDAHFNEPLPHTPGSMRLSKRMSELGIASRREADEWIAAGWVRVDGQVVKELGSRVVIGQQVTVDAKARHQQAQRVTVLVNKPVGYVSGQAEDGYEPAVVLVTPQNQWREDHSGTRFLREHLRSLVPAGRLDIDSVGLLVLTQDGRVAKQLVGEDSDIEKEYLVRVGLPAGGELPDASLALLKHGLELDGEALRPAQVEWVNEDQLRFVLKQGKKRQIRRMCEAVGLKVVGLKRVRIGAVMLGDLPAGQWRYLKVGEKFA